MLQGKEDLWNLAPRTLFKTPVTHDQDYPDYYTNRTLARLESRHFPLTDDLERLKHQELEMVMIGVGQGLIAMELALKYPNLKITAINKEASVWNIARLKEEFVASKKYTIQQFEEAMSRISVAILNIDDRSDVDNHFKNRKFDFIVFEPFVLPYIKDKVRLLEHIFNAYLKDEGIFAFHSVNLLKINDYDSKVLLRPENILRNAFKKASSITHFVSPPKTSKKTWFNMKVRKKKKGRLSIPLVLDQKKTNLYDDMNGIASYRSIYRSRPSSALKFAILNFRKKATAKIQISG